MMDRARFWRRMRKIGLVALALYLVLMVVAFATHLPDFLIVTTATGAEDSKGAARLGVPFEGGELEIFTAESPAAKASGAKAFVLLFVGNEDRADKYPGPMAAGFGARAVEVWGVNYPGFGGSTGPAHLSRFGPAALAAYDALAAKAKGRPIVVQGTSLGTLGALCIAARRPVAGLYLRNPLALPQLIRGEFGWWNLWLFAGPVSWSIPPAIDGAANARKATAPCTFVLSDSDEVIPPRYQQLVVKAYAGEKQEVVIVGGKHNSALDAAARTKLEGLEDAMWERVLGK